MFAQEWLSVGKVVPGEKLWKETWSVNFYIFLPRAVIEGLSTSKMSTYPHLPMPSCFNNYVYCQKYGCHMFKKV